MDLMDSLYGLVVIPPPCKFLFTRQWRSCRMRFRPRLEVLAVFERFVKEVLL